MGPNRRIKRNQYIINNVPIPDLIILIVIQTILILKSTFHNKAHQITSQRHHISSKATSKQR